MIEEIIADTKALLMSDPRMAPFVGGVLTLNSIEEWPAQTATPAVVIIDPGGHDHSHLSGFVRDSKYALEVWVVQRNFNRQELQTAGPSTLPISACARIVMQVLDMNRHGGKYASIYLNGEGKPAPVITNHPQLQGKPLTFEVRRIESPS